MEDRMLAAYVAARVGLAAILGRAREEVGEGVISTAIAVLIMALLGAAMWAAFSGIFDRTSSRVGTAVDGIGN